MGRQKSFETIMAVTGQNSAFPNAGGSGADDSRDPGDVTREMSIGPLLARANLLRMRRQWAEAIAVCTEALRQAPKSPTAHSVLGDIYEAQGKLEDALQWYGMAVDLAPNRAADREKLERVITMQREHLQQQDSERAAGLNAHRAQMSGKLSVSAGANSSGTGGRAAAERTIEWFDRIFPPGRSESIARLIFALCGIIGVLIATAAVFVYTSSNRNRTTGSLLAEGGTNASGLPSLSEPSPPVMVAVPPVSAPPPAQQVPKQVPSSGAAATPSASATDTPTLLAQLGQTLPPGIAVTSLQGEGTVNSPYQMQIALPKAAGEAPPATQERFLRGATIAARSLAILDNHSTQIMIRASLRDQVMAARSVLPTNPPQDMPLFQGSVSAAAIRAIDPSLTPTASLQAQFTNVLWAATLRTPATDAAVNSAANPALPASPAGIPVPSSH